MKKAIATFVVTVATSATIPLFAAPATTNDFYVGASYTADATHFNTVQAAFDAVPADQEDNAYIIHLAAGTYTNRVVVNRNCHNVTLVGDERHPENYVIIGYNTENPTTGNEEALRLEAAMKNFEARGISFFTSRWIEYRDGGFDRSSGSAHPHPGILNTIMIATRNNPVIFRHCRIEGGQDTLYLNGGGGYFEDCFISGDTDYIYGNRSALFNRCELYEYGGYFTADGHDNNPAVNIGYLFYKCRFNVMEGKTATLGRSWRSSANVWLADCYLGPRIETKMWSPWNDVKGKTVYRDYGTRSDTTFSPPNNKGQWGEGIIVRGTTADFWAAMAGFGYDDITDIFDCEIEGGWHPEIHPAVEIR